MKTRILVVDDEECIRESIKIYFTDKGYEVATLAHPSHCDGSGSRMCHGQEECADVLIIDQWMPEMTGIEYLARRHDWGCRSMGQRKALMSANLPDKLRAQAIELGCVIFDKPVLLAQIENWIRESAVPYCRSVDKQYSLLSGN